MSAMAGSIFAARKPPAKAQSVEKVMVILRNFFEQRPNSVLLGCFREQDADGTGRLELLGHGALRDCAQVIARQSDALRT